jgi:penicillin-binding protein 1A
LQKSDDYEQIISPETSLIMNKLLQTVFYGSGGTARGYAVANHRTFGKTGTTTSNKDRWCVAGTSYYIAAVWYGYDYNKQIHESGSPAGRIFEEVMNSIHKDLPEKDFEKYTDDVVSRTYCTSTGLIAGEGCSGTATGWYKKSNIPAVCDGGCGVPKEEESTTGTGNPEDVTLPGSLEGLTKPVEIPSEIPSVTLPEIPTNPPVVTTTPAT